MDGSTHRASGTVFNYLIEKCHEEGHPNLHQCLQEKLTPQPKKAELDNAKLIHDKVIPDVKIG